MKRLCILLSGSSHPAYAQPEAHKKKSVTQGPSSGWHNMVFVLPGPMRGENPDPAGKSARGGMPFTAPSGPGMGVQYRQRGQAKSLKAATLLQLTTERCYPSWRFRCDRTAVAHAAWAVGTERSLFTTVWTDRSPRPIPEMPWTLPVTGGID